MARSSLKALSLIKKGAEADLLLDDDWHGRKAVLKKRVPKGYRAPQLDEKIRAHRTAHELKLLHRAKELGVPTPAIFLIDVGETTIVMEFVEGKPVKQALEGLSQEERVRLCRRIGELIGRLHEGDLIHGDLTTSNIILTSNGGIVFVDFGLGEFSKELEARGVDLHLMKRALQSTHYQFVEECFNAIIDGYKEVVGDDVAKEVLKKVNEIERRGRYVSERVRK